MAVGNLVLGGSPSWNTDSLNLGSGSYLISEGVIDRGSGGEFSVSIALKVNTISGGYWPIITASQSNNTTTGSSLFALYHYRSTLILAYRKASSNSTIAGGALTVSNNYVIDITFDGATWKLYLNGILVGSSNDTNVAKFTSLLGIHCFTNASAAQTIGTGDMDVYAINTYSRALTAEEIETNFNTYNSRFSLGL